MVYGGIMYLNMLGRKAEPGMSEKPHGLIYKLAIINDNHGDRIVSAISCHGVTGSICRSRDSVTGSLGVSPALEPPQPSVPCSSSHWQSHHK